MFKSLQIGEQCHCSWVLWSCICYRFPHCIFCSRYFFCWCFPLNWVVLVPISHDVCSDPFHHWSCVASNANGLSLSTIFGKRKAWCNSPWLTTRRPPPPHARNPLPSIPTPVVLLQLLAGVLKSCPVIRHCLSPGSLYSHLPTVWNCFLALLALTAIALSNSYSCVLFLALSTHISSHL